MAEANKTLAESLEKTGLLLYGQATDQIWAMMSSDGLIGLRLDSGDAGVVYMTKQQAQQVIGTLQNIIEP